jgi:Domain of unknown function (DUF397)
MASLNGAPWRKSSYSSSNGNTRVEVATWRKASYSSGSGTNCVEVGAWRKASYSGSSGTNCVEVGHATRVVSVRDTKDRDGFALSVEADAWERFTDSLK